jgi:hypothetical protein
MGLAVHVENQLHEREYLGSEPGKWLAELLEEANPAGQLSTVGAYGDTMFNIGQMRRILQELNDIAAKAPKLSHEASEMGKIIDMAIKERGYLWIAGD